MATNMEGLSEIQQRLMNDPGILMMQEARRKFTEEEKAARAQQQKELEAERQRQYSILEQQLSKIPQENLKYPAVQHDVDVFRRRIDRDLEYRMIDPSSKGADTQRTIIKDRYGDLKDFIDTDQYKDAEKAAFAMKNTFERSNRLGKSITEMQRILDNDGDQAAAQYGRTSLMKELNSLWGSDVVGTTEAILKYSDVIPTQLRAQMSRMSPFDASLMLSNILMDKKNPMREGLLKGLSDKIAGIYDEDPVGFIATAKSMQDVSARTHNDNVRMLQERTSPYHLKRLGVEPLVSLFDQEKQSQNAAAMSGAGVIQTAPSQQPSSSSATIQGGGLQYQITPEKQAILDKYRKRQ